jgi:hypothetical protein
LFYPPPVKKQCLINYQLSIINQFNQFWMVMATLMPSAAVMTVMTEMPHVFLAIPKSTMTGAMMRIVTLLRLATRIQTVTVLSITDARIIDVLHMEVKADEIRSRKKRA